MGPNPANITFSIALIGLILILVGWICNATIIKLEDRDAIENMYLIYLIFVYIGTALLAVGMFFGGIKGDTFDDRIRSGLLLGGGLLIGLVVAMGMIFPVGIF